MMAGSLLSDALAATVDGRRALACARLRDMLIQQRWRLRLTQQQVADRMGNGGRSLVCDWESGRRMPTLGNLIAWSEALNLTLTLSLNDTEMADAEST